MTVLGEKFLRSCPGNRELSGFNLAVDRCTALWVGPRLGGWSASRSAGRCQKLSAQAPCVMVPLKP